MEKSQQGKMKIKIFSIVFCLFVFITVMFSYISSQFQTQVSRENQSFDIATQRLELNLNTKLMSMEFLASDPEIKSLKPDDVYGELVRPLEILKFSNVEVVDRNGKVVSEIHSNYISDVVYPIDDLDKVLLGKNEITDVILDGKQLGVSLRVPIYGEQGEVKAALIGVMLLEDIGKLVETDYLGVNRYIFIKDGNNNKVYYPAGNSENDFYRDMDINLGKKMSGIVEDRSIGHKEKRLYIYNTVENSNWKIVMVIPMKEIYKIVLHRSFNFFLASCLLLVCAMLMYRNYHQQRSYEVERSRLHMERLQSVNELAAGIAHEIRNPLTSIKGFIQLIARRGDQVPNQSHIEIVLTEINRIDKLVGEFQLLTRPLKTPNYIRIDVERMIGDVIILMESQAVDKSVQLEFSNKIDLLLAERVGVMERGGGQKKVHVFGEETQLKQVLINLVKNAIEVVGENGEVDIALGVLEEMVIITVRDNGIGMSDEILRKVGTPFFTTKASGNGLGLSVCYNIIHNHGGIIKVTSEVGKGTIFSVQLPYVTEDQ